MKLNHVLPAVAAIVLSVAGLVATVVVEKFHFDTVIGAGIGAAVIIAVAVAVILSPS